MSRAALSMVVLLGACTLAFAACASIEGLSDLTFDRPSDGSGGSGGSTSASQSSSSHSSASTGSGVEDCQNGVDDNGDTKVDCADDACKKDGFTCAAVPPGWIGITVLYDGVQTSQSCPADFPMQVYTGTRNLKPAPAKCSMCTCTTATTCTASTLDEWTGPVCSTGKSSDMQPAGCFKVMGGAPLSYSAAPPAATTPACMSAGGDPDTTINWGEHGVACAPAKVGGGCGTSEVCAPKPSGAPFGNKLCIYQTGDQMCPANWPTKRTYVDGGKTTDTRACTACSCGQPMGGSCTATTTLYNDGACNNAINMVPNDGTCIAAVGQPNSGQVVVNTMDATCVASGGVASGTLVAGTNVTTFCCAK